MDAERTVLAGRAEVARELEHLRAAHEVRVAAAARELEALRQRDEEATAHAVRASEHGVAAALGEAAAAVEDAYGETRQAAAAFSTALMLRAWWMHARHKGEAAREAAVDALQGPRRRGLLREALLAWAAASPAPAKAARASRWRTARLKTAAVLAWLRVRAAAAAAAKAASAHASRRTAARTRRTLTSTLHHWTAAAAYERQLRVAHHRVTVKTRRAGLRRTLAAWNYYRRKFSELEKAGIRLVAHRAAFIVRTYFMVGPAVPHLTRDNANAGVCVHV